MSDVPISPRDVLTALFRHKKKMVTTFCVLLSAVVLACLLWPKSYSSEASIVIRVGHETVTLDPTATNGETMQVQKSEQTQVNTVMKILESRQLSERVVERIGVEAILTGELETGAGGQRKRSLLARAKGVVSALVGPAIAMLRSLDGGATPDWERAVERVRKMTVISSPKESTIVSIRCVASSPEMAQRLAAVRLEEFQKDHIRLTKTLGSYEFFLQQRERLELELSDASQALRDRKNEFRLLSVEGKQKALEDERSNVRVQALNAQGLLTAAQARVKQLENQLDTMSEMVVTSELSGVESQALANVKSLFFQYQAEYKSLTAKFSADHHQVVEVRRKIEDLNRLIAQEQAAVTQRTSGINPNYQRLEYELAEARANVESLRSQAGAWEQDRERIENELQDVNDQAIEIQDLERRVADISNRHQSCLEKLEQARLNKELRDRGISSLNVVQQASLNRQSLGPKKKFSLLIGMVFAICGSLGVAIVAEMIDQSVRSSEQLSQQLGLPVLACIPATRSHRLSYLIGRQQWFGRNESPETQVECSADDVLESEFIH